jgi:hypothetical protein
VVAAVYFFCSYWMDKYNLLRLFAVRKHGNDKVGSGIVCLPCAGAASQPHCLLDQRLACHSAVWN